MRATRSPARCWEQATQPTAARGCSSRGIGAALLLTVEGKGRRPGGEEPRLVVVVEGFKRSLASGGGNGASGGGCGLLLRGWTAADGGGVRGQP